MADGIPLTLQQKWLWGLLQDHPGWKCAATYAFRLRGALNVDLLQESLEEVVRRHMALRLRLSAEDAAVLRESADATVRRLEVLPVPGGSDVEIEAAARRQVEQFCDADLDILADLLWASRLLRLSEQEHWLVLTMHRMIGDCASIDQTYREIRICYDARQLGRPSPLSPAAQYGDYSVLQSNGADRWLIRHQGYWHRLLQDLEPLHWPADPDCAPISRGLIGKISCSFGEELSAEVRELGRTARTLAATAMMAIFVAVLWRWCRQNEFALAFNTVGRQTEHKSTLGYFSYVLYLRARLTGTETFRQLLDRLSSDFFAALAHQDYGKIAMSHPHLLAGVVYQWITWHPDDVADASGPENQDPLKPAMERVPVRDFGEGLTVVPPGMTDLELTFFDTPRGIRALGTYRADRFAASTLDRFMADLRSAAQRFTQDPGAALNGLDGNNSAPTKADSMASTAAAP